METLHIVMYIYIYMFFSFCFIIHSFNYLFKLIYRIVMLPQLYKAQTRQQRPQAHLNIANNPQMHHLPSISKHDGSTQINLELTLGSPARLPALLVGIGTTMGEQTERDYLLLAHTGNVQSYQDKPDAHKLVATNVQAKRDDR